MKYLKNFIKDETLRIARVDMIFDNHNIIEKLVARGNAIKIKDKEGITKTEDEIHQSKNSQYLSKVCGAFITFDAQDCYVRVCDRLRDSKLQIFGEEAKVVLKSDEPSNYIWENMHVSDEQIRKTKMKVMTLFCLVLFTGYQT
jgi:hypothetical protein